MVGKFAKELTSRMLSLLSMMEAWMQNLSILKLERLSSQVKLIYAEQIMKYDWFMAGENYLYCQFNNFSSISDKYKYKNKGAVLNKKRKTTI